MSRWSNSKDWKYCDGNCEGFDAYLSRVNPRLRRRLITGEYAYTDFLGKEVMAPQNNKKITKKFYVGSPKMNPLSSDGEFYNRWAKSSVEEAIAAARVKCEETGEPQIVVQIIRVVKPQKTPIVVEKV